MKPFMYSGIGEGDGHWAFQLIQNETGSRLLSGKDCILRYFPDPAVFSRLDSVVLNVSGPDGEQREIFVPRSGLLIDELSIQGPSLGLILRGFIFSRAGVYDLAISFLDKNGKVLTGPLPVSLGFSHDIDRWTNEWIPNGLAI